MKQTAVEWLVEKLSYSTSDGTIISHHQNITHLFEQAKAMEKEQCLKMLPYDLNELAEKACPDVISSAHSAFKAGFQKALELLTFKSE